ncbi:MAG TPA: LysM domain-containing protein, partial [Caldilineales bacterium]|nr:LysM domain-containing protein [Caldilineales bacterium]
MALCPLPPHSSFGRISFMNSRRFLLLLFGLALLFWPGVARGQEGPTEYTIQPGDTLFNIAQRFDVPMELLVQVNDLADSNLIQAGQTLIIPSAEEAARARQAAQA